MSTTIGRGDTVRESVASGGQGAPPSPVRGRAPGSPATAGSRLMTGQDRACSAWARGGGGRLGDREARAERGAADGAGLRAGRTGVPACSSSSDGFRAQAHSWRCAPRTEGPAGTVEPARRRPAAWQRGPPACSQGGGAAACAPSAIRSSCAGLKPSREEGQRAWRRAAGPASSPRAGRGA